MKKSNRVRTQRTDKDTWWCPMCDAKLAGHTGLCSNCGCKAKLAYPNKKKGMNFYEDELEDNL